MNVGELKKELENINPELPVIIELALNKTNILMDVSKARLACPFNRERWFIIKAQTEEKEETSE